MGENPTCQQCGHDATYYATNLGYVCYDCLAQNYIDHLLMAGDLVEVDGEGYRNG